MTTDLVSTPDAGLRRARKCKALEGSDRGPLRAGRWVLRSGRFDDAVLAHPPAGWGADINDASFGYGRSAELDVEGPRFELWGSHGRFGRERLTPPGRRRRCAGVQRKPV
jgi:hypothetical protein